MLALDDSRPVPSQTMFDGHNYYPTNKWVLFGHHFAAISGAGPLIGPVLAAQFGYLPGLLWLVIGVCLGGAVHDFMIMAGSVRRKGKSLAEMARTEISPLSGLVAGVAILFIVVIALAGLGLVVVNALAESPWGTFTVGFTIPLALLMGLYMYRFRKGKIAEASIIGIIGLMFAVWLGGRIAESPLAETFTLSRNSLILIMAAYGFIASVLPVWMLLCPRDYLSSYLKIGTIAFLIIGVIVVHPNLNMPAFTPFTAGGGPVIPGKLYPFVFITIACGAISGFHALVSSGTTPKMIAKETDTRMIGYGSMLMEGVVGVVALIAAASFFPGDYFAINTAQRTEEQKAAYVRLVDTHTDQGFNLQPQEIDRLEQESGEKNLRGRTGGAVTLALGIAKIFAGIPGLGGLMKYWYHFAIMFEALFILTTIDTGTRVARFLVGEFGGRFYKKLEEPNWLPGSIVTSAACGCRLGGFHLVRLDFHDLADVWHCQSTTCRRCLVRSDDDSDQLRQSKVCLGNDRAVVIRQHYHTGGGVQINNRHLLAVGAKARDGNAGLHQHQPHRDHHVCRGGHHARLDPALARNPKGPGNYTNSRTSL